jgi:hypothetical protein
MSLQAVLYSAPNNGYKTPLLTEEESDIESIVDEPQNNEMHRFNRSSLCMGLLTGLFLQMCTLGVNYLLLTAWNMDLLTARNSKEVIVASLIWSFATASISCAIMSLLRNLVVAPSGCTHIEADNHDEMILHMECRFAAGALMGLSLAWTATDVALGSLTGSCLVSSAITLISALTCFRAMVWYFTASLSLSEDELV